MQLICNIPDELYTKWDTSKLSLQECTQFVDCVMKGIPLPEHGRLIDADFIKELGAECIAVRADDNELYALGAIDELPTIIPATEEEGAIE